MEISGTFTNPYPDDISPGEWKGICNQVLDYCQKISPVKTGKFKSSWSMDVDGDDVTYSNPVDYAEYLEDGTSAQAPSGILRPAEAYLDRLADETMKRKSSHSSQGFIDYRNRTAGR